MKIVRLTSPAAMAAILLLVVGCSHTRRTALSSCNPSCGAGTYCNESGECVALPTGGDAGMGSPMRADAGSTITPRVDAGTASTTPPGRDAGVTFLDPDAGSTTSTGGGTTTGNYCGACTSDADCGGGNNFCLAFSFGNYCGTDCGAGQTCPANADCQAIGDGAGGTVGMNCVPSTGLTCSSTGGTTGGTTGGSTGNYCGACTSDADCGGGNNFCLAFSFGDYCGTDCGAGQACPTNSACQAIGDGAGGTVGMNCVPTTGHTCSGTTGGTSGGTDAGTRGSDAGTGSGSCTTDTYASWAGTFFENHCIGCHGGEFSASDARSRRSTIASYISSGSMPRGETLSSADRNRILTWLNCGAP